MAGSEHARRAVRSLQKPPYLLHLGRHLCHHERVIQYEYLSVSDLSACVYDGVPLFSRQGLYGHRYGIHSK